MDTSGFSQIGRYGTISLMKRQEIDTAVTAFGIDTEELTFGRDPSCSVRLYYKEINLVHCKIIFEERKAFLVVLGQAGLVVDGCRVYPNGTPDGEPTTVPLSNNSEIEIHGKRFRFSYPPKEIRAALLATPARLIGNNRRIRLSMIHSAQVFSPRPSKDPRENLRILQSPMKNSFSPQKPSALSRTSSISATHEDGDEEEEIVLVDGNRPRVVEEEKDLVILEDVEVSIPEPVVQIQPPKTPTRRRSQSLHRAVLIRSAQRAVVEHERQRRQEEEEREEMEVLDTIASDDISIDEEVDPSQHDREELPPSDDEPDSDEDEPTAEADQQQRKSLWRKSFERLWPFGNSSQTEVEATEEGGAEHEEPEESSEEDQENEEESRDQPEALPSLPQATPTRRPLGSFMTPQAGGRFGQSDSGESTETPRGRLGGGPPIRYSLGGEARRVPLESSWRVKDLVVPFKGESTRHVAPIVAAEPNAGAPRRSLVSAQPQASPVRPRMEVSVEERKKIQERRRSALREVDSHSYFVGGIPGMSPSKVSGSSVKPEFNDTKNPFRSVSPTKTGPLSPVKDIERRLSMDEEDEKLDTRSLLERMKETVDGMKRRRSSFGPPAQSPTKASPNENPFNDIDTVIRFDGDSVDKENDENAMDVDSEPVLLLRSPSKSFSHMQMRNVEEPAQEPTEDGAPVVPIIVEEIAANEQVPPQEEPAPTNPVRIRSQLEAPTRHSHTRSRSSHPAVVTAQLPESRKNRKAVMEPEEVEDAPVVNTLKRNTRQATRKSDHEAPPATTQTRRARKPTVEPEESQPARRGRKTPTVEEQRAPPPKRTVRKVVVKEEKDDEAAPSTQPSRRGRATKATAMEGVEKEIAVPKARTTSRARGAKAPSSQSDNADGDDPLDALNGQNAPADADSSQPPPTKAMAKARKPRTTVKQEESATEVLKTSTKPRSTIAATTKTPATTARGRARKTPATAPTATQIEVDKENTPGSGTRAGPSNKDATGADDGVVVKVRTTRKTVRPASVKQETDEPVVTQPKARATRTTRARTKTT
ncbi:hypothetical protein AN958_05911 [Leucoagaricus sp. SymC.cos]|nr:hypothetical protein AN958_05911 [Leucoagaricus sp. SymC.cos]